MDFSCFETCRDFSKLTFALLCIYIVSFNVKSIRNYYSFVLKNMAEFHFTF
jgi:hypothetical protein